MFERQPAKILLPHGEASLEFAYQSKKDDLSVMVQFQKRREQPLLFVHYPTPVADLLRQVVIRDQHLGHMNLWAFY